MPAFLNSILHNTVFQLGKAKKPQAVVIHQGLVKLIIIHELDRQHLAWHNFVNPEIQEPEANPEDTETKPPRENPPEIKINRAST